jgi:hypothetical protein
LCRQQALNNRLPMALRRERVTDAPGQTEEDKTLRMEKAQASPGSPLPPQQR